MAVRRVQQKLLQRIRVALVIRFNSHSYDLNVLKSPLMRHLVCLDAVGDGGGGDGDVADGGDDNSDSASSCLESDSGDSDNSEADGDDDYEGPLRFVVKRSNALIVAET